MCLKPHNFAMKLDVAKCSRRDQIGLVTNCNGLLEEQIVRKIRDNGGKKKIRTIERVGMTLVYFFLKLDN